MHIVSYIIYLSTLSLTVGKCGTDALISYLNISDSIIVNTVYNSDYKELNYFNSNYEKGTQW